MMSASANVVKNIVDDLPDDQIGSKLRQYLDTKKWDEFNVLLDTQISNSKRNWDYIFNKYKKDPNDCPLSTDVILRDAPARIVKKMVDNGANKTISKTPVYISAEKRDWSSVKNLLNSGADPNFVDPETKQTILHIAAMEFNFRMVSFILEYKSNSSSNSNSNSKRIEFNWNKNINSMRLCKYIFDSSNARLNKDDIYGAISNNKNIQLLEYLFEFQEKNNCKTGLLVSARDMQRLAEIQRYYKFDPNVRDPYKHATDDWERLGDDKKEQLANQSNKVEALVNVIKKRVIDNESYNGYDSSHRRLLSNILKWHEMAKSLLDHMRKDGEHYFGETLKEIADIKTRNKRFNKFNDKNIDPVDWNFILNEYNTWAIDLDPKTNKLNDWGGGELIDKYSVHERPILVRAIREEFAFGVKKLLELGVCLLTNWSLSCFVLFCFLFYFVFAPGCVCVVI